MAEKELLRVEVEVAVRPEEAFRFFTDPDRIREWNFASPDWACPRAENDLRVGGTFSYRMEAKDGSFGFDFGGTFTAIEPGKRLDYLLGDGRKVAISFEPSPRGCRLVEDFEAEGQNTLERQRGGWQAILDNYKKAAEQGL